MADTDTASSPLAAAWRRMDTRPPAAADRPEPGAPLSDVERELLDFETRPWARGGEKMTAIRATFGWSETRYYQVLLALLERRAAVEYSPALVLRLRRRLESPQPGRRTTVR